MLFKKEVNKLARKDKLVQAVLQGKKISSEEAVKVLNLFGYEAKKQTSGSSHITFSNGKQILTIVLDNKELKNHYIKKLQEIIKGEVG